MMRAHRGLALALGLCLAAPLIVPDLAHARRLIGGAEKDDKKDEKKDDKKSDPKDDETPDPKKTEAEKKKEAEEKAAAEKKAAEEAAAKKAADAEAREAEIERKQRERELAEEAAERAAKEAKEKAEEAKRKAEEQKRRKVEERKEANRAARLRSAKKQRTLTRDGGEILVIAKMTPGGPEGGKVLEVRFDIGKKLKVASARYGNSKPLKNLKLVATVTGPDGETRYRVHPLRAAGAYAFHTTPSAPGEYGLSLKGEGVDASFTVHVGVWPPPDFEEEEKLNAASSSKGTGRRILQ